MFNPLNFFWGRGVSSALSTALTPTIHRYYSADDNFAAITTNGYFDQLIQPTTSSVNQIVGINDNHLIIGDFIQVKDSTNATTFITVTQLSPTIITQEIDVNVPAGSIGTTELGAGSVTRPKLATDVYTSSTLNGQFSGPWASPIVAAVFVEKNNNTVTVALPEISALSTISTIITYSVNLDSAFRPNTLAVFQTITILNNGVPEFGTAEVTPTGQLRIGINASLNGFGAAGDAGIIKGSFSYIAI